MNEKKSGKSVTHLKGKNKFVREIAVYLRHTPLKYATCKREV
jgi:hypothetical protein